MGRDWKFGSASVGSRLCRNPARLLKLARFGFVGLSNGVIYAVMVVLLVSTTTLTPRLAGAVAYLAVVPWAFLAHRRFVFQSSGSPLAEFGRFIAAQLTNGALSVATMSLVANTLGLWYGLGILAAVILVPLVNFLVLDRWVFYYQKSSDETRRGFRDA